MVGPAQLEGWSSGAANSTRFRVLRPLPGDRSRCASGLGQGGARIEVLIGVKEAHRAAERPLCSILLRPRRAMARRSRAGPELPPLRGAAPTRAPTLAWAPTCGSATCLAPNGSVPRLLQMENCRGSAERLDLGGRDRGLHARVLAGPPRPFRNGR